MKIEHISCDWSQGERMEVARRLLISLGNKASFGDKLDILVNQYVWLISTILDLNNDAFWLEDKRTQIENFILDLP